MKTFLSYRIVILTDLTRQICSVFLFERLKLNYLNLPLVANRKPVKQTAFVNTYFCCELQTYHFFNLLAPKQLLETETFLAPNNSCWHELLFGTKFLFGDNKFLAA